MSKIEITSHGSFAYSYYREAIRIQRYVEGNDPKKVVEKVIVPEVIDGYPVTHICKNAFENALVKEVILPDTVTHIENKAFYQCSNLEQIYLSESLLEIGSSAFAESGLKEIVVPGGVSSLYRTFSNCQSLESVMFEDGLVQLGVEVCLNCVKLREVILPQSLETISKLAFSSCVSLTEIIIPDSVIEIGNSVFRDCKSLKNVTLPNKLEVISDHLFYYCESIEEIKIPDNVKTISDYSFALCSALIQIELGNQLEYICFASFYQCSSLKEIIIPDNVHEIGYRAFQECKSLHTVILPTSLSHIYRSAFIGCECLNFISIPSKVKSIDIEAFDTSIQFGNVDQILNKKVKEQLSTPVETIVGNQVIMTQERAQDFRSEKHPNVTALVYSENVKKLGVNYQNSMEVKWVKKLTLENEQIKFDIEPFEPYRELELVVFKSFNGLKSTCFENAVDFIVECDSENIDDHKHSLSPRSEINLIKNLYNNEQINIFRSLYQKEGFRQFDVNEKSFFLLIEDIIFGDGGGFIGSMSEFGMLPDEHIDYFIEYSKNLLNPNALVSLMQHKHRNKLTGINKEEINHGNV
ncbi:hypothetical protein AOC36_06905 [Erysipelothrix larvae]|uniref:Ig-like domain-containing protein n=1 Tax=Erysipelothrix larvae TaxID=1514105 RepID=A0A109UH54_9FIRM|nr:leucine-rich repeat domain-containing protein [Erysipelothrix larvae]AMC93720.1 hypothetical protein AOC36_06905 [Erysipelothrix larvae]